MSLVASLVTVPITCCAPLRFGALHLFRCTTDTTPQINPLLLLGLACGGGCGGGCRGGCGPAGAGADTCVFAVLLELVLLILALLVPSC